MADLSAHYHFPSPWPEHLSRTLPSSIHLALVLDHLRQVEPLSEELRKAIETGFEEVIQAANDQSVRELFLLELLESSEREAAISRASDEAAFCSTGLARLLRDKAMAALPASPDESLHWASLCESVAKRGSTPLHSEWQVHSLYLAANAHRARRDLPEARRWFDRANALRQGLTSRDLGLSQERNRLLSVWRLEKGDLEKALSASARAALQANLAGLHCQQARAAMVTGRIWYQLGQYRCKVQQHRLAVECFEPLAHAPFDALAARFNLAIGWLEAGVWRAARGVILRTKRQFPEYFAASASTDFLLRVTWLEAKISAAASTTGGRGVEPEEESRRAALGFRQAGKGYLARQAELRLAGQELRARGAFRDTLRVSLDLSIFALLEQDTEQLDWFRTELWPQIKTASPPELTSTSQAAFSNLVRLCRDPTSIGINELIGDADRFRTSP